MKAYKTAAWTRAAGKNPKGGLNSAGRASYNKHGHHLKPPVKSGNNPRRAAFLARMSHMKVAVFFPIVVIYNLFLMLPPRNTQGPEHDKHGNKTRLLKSLNAWGASSKADAAAKAKHISNANKKKKIPK